MNYEKYLRLDKFPHIWCAGCGNGIVLKAILRAIEDIGLDKDKIALVSGIGCSSRTAGYVDFNTLHTTHGRALAFATGIKMVKPELTVIVVTGDGDATAIGGNHFIHAARRNIDITAIVFNNYIYGMTGGQVSPTTPVGSCATTTPYGNIEPSFDISKLAAAAGASFVARGTTYHVFQLDKLIKRAILKKGFSVVEVLTPCPTYYGRKNKFTDGAEMLEWLREHTQAYRKGTDWHTEQSGNKILTGVFVDIERPEYVEEHEKLMQQVREQKERGGSKSLQWERAHELSL